MMTKKAGIKLARVIALYLALAVLLMSCVYGFIFMMGKSFEILDKPYLEQQGRINALFDNGYFEIATLDTYPRPSDVEYYCGTVDYVITNRKYSLISEPKRGSAFILFCKDIPAA